MNSTDKMMHKYQVDEVFYVIGKIIFYLCFCLVFGLLTMDLQNIRNCLNVFFGGVPVCLVRGAGNEGILLPFPG